MHTSTLSYPRGFTLAWNDWFWSKLIVPVTYTSPHTHDTLVQYSGRYVTTKIFANHLGMRDLPTEVNLQNRSYPFYAQWTRMVEHEKVRRVMDGATSELLGSRYNPELLKNTWHAGLDMLVQPTDADSSCYHMVILIPDLTRKPLEELCILVDSKIPNGIAGSIVDHFLVLANQKL